MSEEFNNNSQENTSYETGADQNQNSQNQNSQNHQNNQYNQYQQTSAGNGPTGNGNYQYGPSHNSYQGTYHSSYSGSYGSNQGGYDNGRGNNRKNKKSAAGKIGLAVLLAGVFGVCAGAGIYGISKATGDNTKAAAALRIAESSGDEEKAANNEEVSKADVAEQTSSDEAVDEAKEVSTQKLEILSGEQIQTGVTQVVHDVMPAIVSVYNNYSKKQQDFFGQTYKQTGTSTGSGIIISKTDSELLLVTNNHVIEGEDSLQVQFIDETTADAQLKGTDEGRDLAVIAVKLDDIDDETMDKITVATLGSSDDLTVGEPVVAIGNALGYGQSVTTGVVSALNRERTNENGETYDFIQTDAAINPGNSGGALVDLNGHVIGINSQKNGGTVVEGMGYAIPMSDAVPIIEDLMNQKTRERVADEDKGYLGISGVSVTSQVANAYNMPEGVYIAQIIKGAGAENSELQKGDIITKINKTRVSSMEELQEQLSYCKAGEEVNVTVKRADGEGEYQEQEITVTLSDADSIKKDDDSNDSAESEEKEQNQQTAPAQGNYINPFSGLFGY